MWNEIYIKNEKQVAITAAPFQIQWSKSQVAGGELFARN